MSLRGRVRCRAEMWRGGSFFLGTFTWIAAVAYGYTDPSNVAPLNVLYGSLGYPSQLTGWSTDQQGDPCGQDWRGVTCYESSVTELRIESLGLTGQLSSVYNLDNLESLTILNISGNNFHGKLPYQLPPNVQGLDVSGNSFTEGLPFSISELTSLEYLSVSRNQFNGSLNAVLVAKLSRLEMLDLSLNQFSGILPPSFSALSSLTSLYLQNNQFNGTINVLADLPLENLNVENNHFTGSIPGQLRKINNFQFGGNQFNNSPTPTTPPPPRGDHGEESSGGGKSSLSAGAIAGIIIAALVVVGLIVAFFLIRRKTKRLPENQKHVNSPACISVGASGSTNGAKSSQNKNFGPAPEVVVQMLSPSPVSVTPPLPIPNIEQDSLSRPVEMETNIYNIKATVYSVADLQMATESFSRDCLIGEGSIGRVYRAQFDDGKVLAVKKINSLGNSQQASKDFMKVVSGISQLHHLNVTELVGYCCEHGQYLLVYEFHCNGSLHDFLHLSDEYSKPLTWNTRVKIALGTARALEYLHEVCSPSIVHKNFKSANILLDAELSPHLSDCGLSELASDDFQIPLSGNRQAVDRSKVQLKTTALDQYLGSGYSAPEVVMGGQYTPESDVFSFGVVMLELLTGREAFDSSRTRQEQSLVRWATPQLHDIDALDKMVDPALKGLYPAKSLSRFADAIALCVQAEPEFRPPMSEVVQALVRLVQRANMSQQRMGTVGEQGPGNEADTHDMV